MCSNSSFLHGQLKRVQDKQADAENRFPPENSLQKRTPPSAETKSKCLNSY